MKLYNQRTFRYIMRSIENAKELLEANKPKNAYMELKEAIKLLEKDKEPSKLLGICYCLEGDIYFKQKKKSQALKAWQKAQVEFERVHDTSLDYQAVLSKIKSGV